MILDSLLGEDDNDNDAVGSQNPTERVTARRRNVKRRCGSASSFDELDPRRRRSPFSSRTSLEGLSMAGETPYQRMQGSKSDLTLILQPGNSDPKAVQPPLRQSGTEKTPQSSPKQNLACSNPDDDDDGPSDEVVWPHGSLSVTKSRTGKNWSWFPGGLRGDR
jgi:hypothetical protein